MKRGFLKPKRQIPTQSAANTSASSLSQSPDLPAPKPIPPPTKIPAIRVSADENFNVPLYVDDPKFNDQPMRGTKLPHRSQYHGPQITTLMLYPRMKEKILAMLSFHTPFPTLPQQPRYRIRHVGRSSGEGRGLGMFAAVDIEIGDIIACEAALFMGPLGILYDPDLTSDPYELFINHMEAPQREAFMDLSNCKDYRSKVWGILDTNNLRVGALPGYAGAYGGIFRDISRINHRYAMPYLLIPDNGHAQP